jgi:hypothetical protein
MLGVDPRTYLVTTALRSVRGETLTTPYVYARGIITEAERRVEQTMANLPH